MPDRNGNAADGPSDLEKINGSGSGESNLERQESQFSTSEPTRSRPRLRIQVPGQGEETFSPKETPTEGNGSTRHSIGPAASIARATFPKPVRIPVPGDPGNALTGLKNFLGIPDPGWIKNNLDTSHLKPVVRASVAGWLSMVLLVIRPVMNLMGQAPFIIMIAGFISPPAEPFMQVLEREMAILIFTSISYAWSCLGIRLANLARKEFNPLASQVEVFSGRYIEAWPTVICAIFLFVGTAVLLYTRARVGPGPYIVAIVLSCIVTDISLTTGHLFPYPYYGVGQSVVVPIAFHSAIALVCSAFVFPETVNAQFIKRFRVVFLQLSKAMLTQPAIFEKSALSEEFDPSPFFKQVDVAESALAPLAATSRLMKRDISWGRFGSKDFSRLHELVKKMTVRANGMAFYFKIMDSSANRQAGTSAFSLLSTPAHSPPSSRPSSRPPSPTRSMRSANEVNMSSSAFVASSTSKDMRRRRRQQRHSAHNSLYQHALQFYHLHHRQSHHHHHHNHRHFPSSLFHDTLERSSEGAVGVFESQRYLNLEARLTHPNAEEVIPRIVWHLGESARDLTQCTAEALDHLARKFGRMNEDRFYKLFCREREMTWEEGIQDDEGMLKRLRNELEEFRQTKRHRVLELYREHIDAQLSVRSMEEPPSHRYLFQCYLYQYHLKFFAEHLCQMFEELIDLEKTRPRSRLWFPIVPFKQVIMWSKWEPTDVGMQHNEDEDPDIIQGIEPAKAEVLGQPERRDPDALPPSNILEAIGAFVHDSIIALGRGNAVFGFKAGLISVILSLPNYIPNSARFAYVNRSVWALVIGQLTLSRFRGDTIWGWFSRVVATFLGGIIGTVMWYISTGVGNGNSFGLAAVCAVVFPILFFIRLYYPAAPMTLTIFIVTVGLVLGYSWQDAKAPNLSDAGLGINVAWKRFVLVTIGVTVAFIFSYFPPSTTLRRYLRTTYATTAQQLGDAYCDVVSNATLHGGPATEAIVKELIASRLKLKRSKQLMENVVYENKVSLRGKWPKERYEVICEIQLEIAYLLSHLRSVTEHLELKWARAFLKRTRFLEAEFQGDVLAVINMISTALRTGTPLPQVTPCPLLDRFVVPTQHGFHFLRPEHRHRHRRELSASSTSPNNLADYPAIAQSEEDRDGDENEFAGLPRKLTKETLEDEQYLYFSVGVATAFSIVTRLDRLMVATKEIVGEQFHIAGLPVYNSASESRRKEVR